MKQSDIDEHGALLTRAIKQVGWQGVETHMTQGCTKRPSRERTYVAGIPLAGLKRIYTNKNKVLLKRFGFTFFCVGRQATGETVQRRGRKVEIVRKQWEIRLWLNDNNRQLIAGLIPA